MNTDRIADKHFAALLTVSCKDPEEAFSLFDLPLSAQEHHLSWGF